jgi:hypothetical protein
LSTAISEEEENVERKKRKRKVREGELVTTEEGLARRLETLVVNEERGPCRVEEEWLGRMSLRKKLYRSKVMHN